jgi:hypothetical protein
MAEPQNYLCFSVFSSETVSFLRPFFLRVAKTLRPLAEAILSRKPCVFFLFLREGWYVRFIVLCNFKPQAGSLILSCLNLGLQR